MQSVKTSFLVRPVSAAIVSISCSMSRGNRMEMTADSPVYFFTGISKRGSSKQHHPFIYHRTTNVFCFQVSMEFHKEIVILTNYKPKKLAILTLFFLYTSYFNTIFQVSEVSLIFNFWIDTIVIYHLEVSLWIRKKQLRNEFDNCAAKRD